MTLSSGLEGKLLTEHAQRPRHQVSPWYTEAEKRWVLIHLARRGKLSGQRGAREEGCVSYVLAGVLTDDPAVVFIGPVTAV